MNLSLFLISLEYNNAVCDYW